MELVINTFGTSLNRDNEGFVITREGVKQRIPTQGIKSIQISSGAQITSDAVLLAIENEIEILFSDRSGNPIGRVWSPQYGSISTIRKGQLTFSFSHEAVKWIKEIVRSKIENQQALLLMMMPDREVERRKINKAIERMEDYRTKILGLDGEIVSDIAPTLRGWEGVASKIYFETLNLFIPERLRFDVRSQHPAMDPVNALLNYGYGVLYGKIEGALIKAGIDPYIGIMHRDNYNRPVLVYDIIELYRIWIDYVVYSIVIQDVITDEYYSIKEDGSYWLEPFGRRVLIQSVNDYLAEVVDYKGLSRSRLTQISLYAQKLAQEFKKFN
ncbi:CRISPR-associated endonuclease Cas1 [Bacteroides sp. OttesenSCG-928-E20]|nr:CRISPR-associated endonuclease Cas1 [Bacteroides sp. OttesenSCG-928-N06]MDL2299155.1 CRISPR-associated endonuclease Cas1 [Bacteroides sp. OttesenSCG-928-E20]MDL2304642.1 CRISPR-associated endonuclease Cas1 [Bacteroides sp. OttesenSCG-928-D19]